MPRQDASPSSAPRTAPKRARCTYDGCRKLAPPRRKRCDDHKPGRPAAPRAKLYGKTEPRLWTRPLRPLNRQTSRGYEVIDFAEMIGEPLLPWQQFAAIHALELLPDGTYRFRTVLIKVARQNGKSQLKRVITLWRMYVDGARRIIGIAQDVALARDQWNMCQDTIHACPDLEAEWEGVRNVNGDEWFKAAGCRYSIKAANRKAGRGGSNDEVNIDELREQQDWKAWAAASKTTMARDNGQVWALTNEGDDGSVVLNQLTAVADAGTDPALCRLEWSAPEGCELDDRKAWAQANPGLGYIIAESAIESAMHEDPAVFRTEVLCQRVTNLDPAIDPAAWKACADPAGTLDGHHHLAACLDVAIDGNHATLTVAARLDTGQVRLQVAAAWKTADAVIACDSQPETCRCVTCVLARIKPAALGAPLAGPAASIAHVLRPLAEKHNHRPGKHPPWWLPSDGNIAGAKAAEACQQLATLTAGRRILHPADPLLDAHVTAATKLHTGDGWRFTRRGEGHCDAAYAAAGAATIALTMPQPRKARIRVLNAS